ncbi:MAG: hypothetical protein JWN29_937 [Acidimicrobiales bacterium]|jgi:hypothetical protein|nr:hypothetical protein [Acidimicrobiales bacterium]
MESMTLMPMAVADAASNRRRATGSYVRVPETFGALPSMAALANHGCGWSSHTTNALAIRTATTKALKAFGTRRLGETST